MAERAKRGEEDRQRVLDKMTGAPLKPSPTDTTNEGAASANTTRDNGVGPANDNQRAGHGESE